MPDDRTKGSPTSTLVVVSVLTLAALAGLCLCGGFGLFFVRVANSPPPGGAAGPGVPPNEPMLKRFIDNLRGVPQAQPVPPLAPPQAQPVEPPVPEPAEPDPATPEPKGTEARQAERPPD
ncbi:MAG TPA: hypothetical protein VG125_24535 [Pirellulales bacterium]|jgi:hypothetical protein|nr:hypothetical protein [Pirellulales bacterium]